MSDAGSRSRLLDLVSLRPFASELAQVAARGTLESLGAPSVARWTVNPERVARNLAAAQADLLLAAEQIDDELDRELLAAARTIAQGWEDFSRIATGPDAVVARVNAALNYEIAGYQANAACLAREVVEPRQWTTDPTLVGTVAAFLQRFYMRVLQAAPTLQLEPESATFADRDDIVRKAAIAIAAAGVESAAIALMTGDDTQLGAAIDQLELAEVGFAQVGDMLHGSLTSGLRRVLPVMEARSTWRHMAEVSSSDRWRRYLRILGRGLGTTILDARSVSELWPSQVAAIAAGLLRPGAGSLVLRMPTSAGKTRIAEMVLVHSLSSTPGSKCIFVAPFRALASEIEANLALTFADIGYGASAIAGSFEQDEMGSLIEELDDVLVVTPEKLDLLVRLQPDLLDDIALVVVDEGHIVGDRDRGPKFELLVSRLRSRLPNARFVYMSAVVPDETLRQFAQWLGGSAQVSADWRPTVLRHAQLEWSGTNGTLRYARPDVLAGGIDFVPNLIAQRSYEHRSEETGYIRRPKFPTPTSKGEIAAELAYTYAPRGPVLIFCMLPDWVQSTANALLRRVELTELAGELAHYEFRIRDGGRALTVATEWLGSTHSVVSLLRRGIAFHHARLPTAVREAIETDFREGRLSAIVATTTLAQGVNLPINTVIFHSTRMYDEELETTRRLPARDYWNIAGRAGRAGQETRGLAIHLVKTADDRTDFETYSQMRDNPEPVVSGLTDLLLRLVRDRISDAEVAAKLDSDLLALLVEEISPDDAAQIVNDTLGSSLFAIQAEERGLPMGPLSEVMVGEARRIVRSIPDSGRRSVFASTGLSSRGCAAIADHISANEPALRVLAAGQGEGQRASMTDLLIEGLSSVTEMDPRYQVEVDERQLRLRWLEARSLSEISEELSIEALRVSQFVEDYYVYRLPWGVSGYLRIASHLLDDLELSTSTMNIAGMLKYGVPSEEAVWAMTAGVPSRGAALRIATAFRDEVEESTPRSFRRWLGTLEAEDLADRFGLTGIDLEVTTRAVLRSHTNDYLQRLDRGDPLVPLECVCRPRRAAIEQGLPERIGVDDVLSMQRDLDGGIHRNAVQLLFENEIYGYLPIAAAQAVGPEMDVGLMLQATVVGLEDTPRGAVIRVRVEPMSHPA